MNRAVNRTLNRRLALCLAAGIFAGPASRSQSIPPAPPAQEPPLKIALTFDDLPAHGPLAPGETRLDVARSILATLRREQMPPVYGFVNADKVAKYPYQAQVLTMWLRSGNPLGNHTWSHPSLDKSTAAAFNRNIAKDEPLLKKLAHGTDWHWFRFPYLQEGDTAEKREEVMGYLAAHQYKVAEVTIDFEDYLWNDSYGRCSAKKDEAGIAYLEKSYLEEAGKFTGVFRGLAHTLYGRDISYVLLLHIGAFDARMLPRLITLLRQQGFTFTTLEDAQKDQVYSEPVDLGHPDGGTLLELLAAKHGVNFPDDTKPYDELDRICR